REAGRGARQVRAERALDRVAGLAAASAEDLLPARRVALVPGHGLDQGRDVDRSARLELPLQGVEGLEDRLILLLERRGLGRRLLHVEGLAALPGDEIGHLLPLRRLLRLQREPPEKAEKGDEIPERLVAREPIERLEGSLRRLGIRGLDPREELLPVLRIGRGRQVEEDRVAHAEVGPLGAEDRVELLAG